MIALAGRDNCFAQMARFAAERGPVVAGAGRPNHSSSSPCTTSLGEMPSSSCFWPQPPRSRPRYPPTLRRRCRWRSRAIDPVAYFTIGKPCARACPEIEYEWDEHRYRFSRAEHRELFKADPVRYAPQFANFCAMALSMGENRRGQSGELADQRGQALYLRQADAVRTCTCSRRTSPKTSSKRIRTAGSFRSA